jgi:hypothetical protein
MPALTRRPTDDDHRQGWQVYFGDIRVGWIGQRAGVPHDVDQWGWHCGFYPGCEPGQATSGSASTFDEARAGFEKDWRQLLSTRTDADFEAWRDQQAWTAEKYHRFDRGECMDPHWKPA